MQRLEYNCRFPVNPIDPNNSKYRGYAWEALKRGFADKIAELVLDTSRDGTICFSKFRIVDLFGDGPYESVLHGEIDYDFAKQVPVFYEIPDIPTYQGKEIVPPEKLTFRERIKFIFTGKYPR